MKELLSTVAQTLDKRVTAVTSAGVVKGFVCGFTTRERQVIIKPCYATNVGGWGVEFLTRQDIIISPYQRGDKFMCVNPRNIILTDLHTEPQRLIDVKVGDYIYSEILRIGGDVVHLQSNREALIRLSDGYADDERAWKMTDSTADMYGFDYEDVKDYSFYIVDLELMIKL